MTFVVEPLGAHHDRDGFTSGSDALDRYLRQQAGQDVRRNVATVFVLCEPGSPVVLGYYTLSALSLKVGDFPEKVAKKLPRYPFLPATLVGRLAVDRSQQGKRLGKALLFDALKRALEASASVASVAVVVDAKDDTARAFYEHNEFVLLPVATHRLYMMMTTIRGMIEQ